MARSLPQCFDIPDTEITRLFRRTPEARNHQFTVLCSQYTKTSFARPAPYYGSNSLVWTTPDFHLHHSKRDNLPTLLRWVKQSGAFMKKGIPWNEFQLRRLGLRTVASNGLLPWEYMGSPRARATISCSHCRVMLQLFLVFRVVVRRHKFKASRKKEQRTARSEGLLPSRPGDLVTLKW